jgi:hypothetical protein
VKARAGKPAWAFCPFALPSQNNGNARYSSHIHQTFLRSAELRASAFVVGAGMQTLEEEVYD